MQKKSALRRSETWEKYLLPVLKMLSRVKLKGHLCNFQKSRIIYGYYQLVKLCYNITEKNFFHLCLVNIWWILGWTGLEVGLLDQLMSFSPENLALSATFGLESNLSQIPECTIPTLLLVTKNFWPMLKQCLIANVPTPLIKDEQRHAAKLNRPPWSWFFIEIKFLFQISGTFCLRKLFNIWPWVQFTAIAIGQ